VRLQHADIDRSAALEVRPRYFIARPNIPELHVNAAHCFDVKSSTLSWNLPERSSKACLKKAPLDGSHKRAFDSPFALFALQ